MVVVFQESGQKATQQDQKEEFDFEWSEVSGFASSADNTWEETIKQISLESEDSFIFDSKDLLFDLDIVAK